MADRITNEWARIAAAGDGAAFIRDKLDKLGKRRSEIEASILSLESTISGIKRDAVDQELVTFALSEFSRVFGHIQPHNQKDLLKLVLHKAILPRDRVKIGLYGQPIERGHCLPMWPPYETEERSPKDEERSPTLTWLPNIESNSNL